ncbi:rod shape-determining protein MreC [Spirochaeta thermophila DSM 6578]|uniref:Cell shape-determining protein MreC n=1 Tax=Winmispira thermophila (strain ATCC 700085 / DSM 6578 / Z-1203) TaxID=869211 RepID=G0GDN9_WINT7|nr:rod shape-determining protein MreC [Spirochaeta thermophila]AEJ61386.1 rod shape-determining protein MreC [Spirochaeta thermophila DSM 6578]
MKTDKWRDRLFFTGGLYGVLLVLLLSSLGMGETLSFGFFSYLYRFGGKIGETVTSTLSNIRSRDRLLKENEALRRELDRYRGLYIEYLALKEEYMKSRAVLGLQEGLGYRSVAARVLADEPSLLFSGFIIDRGRSTGIQKGLPVVTLEGSRLLLIGKIDEVGGSTSRVIPLFRRNFYVAAELVETGLQGLVHGAGEGTVVMEYIPKTEKHRVSVGEVVVTSHRSTVFPPGIEIGRVEKIVSYPHESSLLLYLRPSMDPHVLTDVFVLLPDDEDES